MDHDVAAAMTLLAAADPAVVERDELAGLVTAVRTVRGWLDGVEVRCTRRGQQLADAGRAEGVTEMLLDQGRRSGREAKAATDRTAVCDELPEFEGALGRGEVSSDHLDVVARTMRGLNDGERADLRDRAAELADRAATEYVSQFARTCRNVVDEIRTARAPTVDAAAAELDRQRAMSKVSHWTDQSTGMHKTLIELDPLRDETLWTALDAHVAAIRQQPGNAGTPYAQLVVDAVVGAVGGSLPLRPGEARPEVSVLIDLETLRNGAHAGSVCETAAGTMLPVSTLRRLCCDADIIPIVLGTDSEVLDVGRASRVATRAQRRALRAMYRTCGHPQCEVPFNACRIHHIVPWWQGGTTDLHLLVPLCERHHHAVHEGGWTLTADQYTLTWLRPDGTLHHRGPAGDRAARAGAADPPDASTDDPPRHGPRPPAPVATSTRPASAVERGVATGSPPGGASRPTYGARVRC